MDISEFSEKDLLCRLLRRIDVKDYSKKDLESLSLLSKIVYVIALETKCSIENCDIMHTIILKRYSHVPVESFFSDCKFKFQNCLYPSPPEVMISLRISHNIGGAGDLVMDFLKVIGSYSNIYGLKSNSKYLKTMNYSIDTAFLLFEYYSNIYIGRNLFLYLTVILIYMIDNCVDTTHFTDYQIILIIDLSRRIYDYVISNLDSNTATTIYTINTVIVSEANYMMLVEPIIKLVYEIYLDILIQFASGAKYGIIQKEYFFKK